MENLISKFNVKKEKVKMTETHEKDTVFMNIYDTSWSKPTKEQKALLNWSSKNPPKCSFCKNNAIGLLHVVKADIKSLAKNRLVRLAIGCQDCNVGQNSFYELKLEEKTDVLKTKQTCSKQIMFILDSKL